MEAVLAMFRSRKFWATIMDLVFSTTIYFVTKYAAPEVGDDILWLIGAWQPVVMSYILGTAWEDSASKMWGNSPK